MAGNAKTVELYHLVADDWRTDGWGGRTGIPSRDIESALRIARVPIADRLERLQDLKTMTRLMVREWNQEKEKRRNK